MTENKIPATLANLADPVTSVLATTLPNPATSVLAMLKDSGRCKYMQNGPLNSVISSEAEVGKFRLCSEKCDAMKATDGANLIREYAGKYPALLKKCVVPGYVEIQKIRDGVFVTVQLATRCGCDLLQWLSDEKLHRSEEQRLAVMLQMAEDVACMHGVELVHGDLKMENFVVQGVEGVDEDEDVRIIDVRIIDFDTVMKGEAGATYGTHHGEISLGTMCNMPPEWWHKGCAAAECERRHGARITKSVDMWCLGIAMFSVITNVMPGITADQSWKKWLQKEFPSQFDFKGSDMNDSSKLLNAMKTMVEDCNKKINEKWPQYSDLISKLLVMDEGNRLSAQQLVEVLKEAQKKMLETKNIESKKEKEQKVTHSAAADSTNVKRLSGTKRKVVG